MDKTELDKFLKSKAEFQKNLKDAGGKLLTSLTKDFFNTHPEVLAIRWRQYTPYFNDGDACQFHVDGNVQAKVDVAVATAMDPEDADDEDGWWSQYSLDSKSQLCKDLQELGNVLEELEDALLASFGDHAEVTMTRIEATVEEYSHD